MIFKENHGQLERWNLPNGAESDISGEKRLGYLWCETIVCVIGVDRLVLGDNKN